METFIWNQFHLTWIKQVLKAGACSHLLRLFRASDHLVQRMSILQTDQPFQNKMSCPCWLLNAGSDKPPGTGTRN